MTYKKHPVKGKCLVYGCAKSSGTRKLCSTHRAQVCRQRDPTRYAFNNLKSNAKRRRILCTITLDQFREWCRKVTYIGFSGRTPDSWTVDRIYNDIGYHADNIQVLKLEDNRKKYFTYDWRYRVVREVKMMATEVAKEDTPF